METLAKFSIYMLINLAVPISTQPQPQPNHPLLFFMHDILGGSNPSTRAMTGIVNNPRVAGLLPFAKPSGMVLPLQPTSNDNNLFLTGLGGAITNEFETRTGWTQLTFGSALQRLMFGTIMVIDDELTEGQDSGSNMIGKAQGFYVASSIEGNSHSMAFTVMFKSGNYIDSLSFLGVHRSGVSESQLAIMGGTGKYINAKGYAKIKTIQLENEQVVDGRETLLEFLTYVTC